jgi:hypothetical protein
MRSIRETCCRTTDSQCPNGNHMVIEEPLKEISSLVRWKSPWYKRSVLRSVLRSELSIGILGGCFSLIVGWSVHRLTGGGGEAGRRAKVSFGFTKSLDNNLCYNDG